MTNGKEVYVGESTSAANRMRQHLESAEKQRFSTVRVVLDDTFNKSACLDLESTLIRMFSGDGQYAVLNLNAGVTDSEYYDRRTYRKTFEQVFEVLRTQEQLFQRTIPQIVNSDLFKFSPFKSLNHDQAIAVEDILDGFFEDLSSGRKSTVVVQGSPGTGKTVLAIYLLKLLQDIRDHGVEERFDNDSIFSEFFTGEHAAMLRSLRVGLVVPQQSLRGSVAQVFKLTPGLSKSLVLTPFQVGESREPFDLLLVDEAHRLNQRANQPSGPLNKKFAEINERLFGTDDPQLTQLDWIQAQSKHTILMLDQEQSVRPADLPTSRTSALVEEARSRGRRYPLRTQMRIAADKDYVGYVRVALADPVGAEPERFGDYDLRFFDDLGAMRREILTRNAEHGLSRMVAGYAWPWASKKDKTTFDIELDGEQLRWNSTQRDWINSQGSECEVGSIHTVQGYDLNYAGVIIGPDLRFDSSAERVRFDRAEYHDKKGRENNPKLGIEYSDEDLLRYVQNVYSVLLTRGIRGTYVYVCDPALRERLRPLFQASGRK